MERKLCPDLPIAIVALVLYTINRFTTCFTSLPWVGPVFRFHFNDYLGSIVFLCYFELLLAARHRDRVVTLPPLLALGGLCSLVWEGLAPRVFSRSTGDWLDCAAYLLGCVTYWALLRIFHQKTRGNFQ